MKVGTKIVLWKNIITWQIISGQMKISARTLLTLNREMKNKEDNTKLALGKRCQREASALFKLSSWISGADTTVVSLRLRCHK